MSEVSETQPKRKMKSGGIMASYGFGKFLAEFFTGAFGALVFKYYETNMGLDSGLTALGIILYSIWNAINDPLIGFFTSKPTPLAKKWGRRFPWILFGSIIWVFTFVFIFAVPESVQANQVTLLLWMIGSTCLYDFLYSVWEVNYQSVFPDKFRGKEERGKASSISIFVGVFGIAAGALVPTFIVKYADSSTFVTNAWTFVIAGLVIIFLLLPGVKEDKEMIDRYMKQVELEKEESNTFFKDLKEAFKERNFLAFILLYFLYQAATMSMTSSIHYVGDYILPGEANDTTIIFAGMLIGALISIPIWLKILKKIGDNQKVITIAAFALAAFTFPMTFISSQIGYIIAMTIWGMGFGGFWMVMTPAMADVIDEIVVKQGKRNDGIYMGFRAFFGRLSYAVQALSFFIVHELTGFVNIEGYTQDALAQLGIHLHMATIPTVFLILGGLIFMKLNSLNKNKMESIHKQLEQMNI